MKLQVILTVFIVNFGLKYVQSYRPMEDKFRNLFDSIAENDDKRKIELYRRALQENASKKQQDYDVMKDEVQFARIKNSYKKINFREKNNMHENIIPSKRATPKPPVIGCKVGTAGGTFPAGKHSLDVDDCIVWYCNYDLELVDYRCKDIKRHENTFPAFWKECNENGCL